MAHPQGEERDEGEREQQGDEAARHRVAEELGAQAQRGGVGEHGADVLGRRVAVQEGPRAQLVAHALRAPALRGQPRRLRSAS